jgi:hypothetical protein
MFLGVMAHLRVMCNPYKEVGSLMLTLMYAAVSILLFMLCCLRRNKREGLLLVSIKQAVLLD